MAGTAVEAELEEYSQGPSVLEREVSPGCSAGAHTLTSVCWHPTLEATLLAVHSTGNIFNLCFCCFIMSNL